jgi:hypothetical protein
MRHITIVLTIITLLFSCKMTQKTPTNYSALWEKVEQLVNKEGLTKSAIAEVKSIYTLAEKENQPAQKIRALVYLTELMEDVSDDESRETIEMIRKELQTARAPEKQLLHSILASRYQQIYEENRWEIMERTPLGTPDELDPNEWSAKEFHDFISKHYLASLEDPALLQQTSLKDYQPLIKKGNASALRPTLYDLLAHQALSYFKRNERDLPDPINVFQVNDPAAFASAKTFANTNFQTEDSSSLSFRALTIYQELIRLHLNDSDPSALIDVDLERLRYMNEVAVSGNKDEQYTAALEQLAARYPQHPMAAAAKVEALSATLRNNEEFNPKTDPSSKQFIKVDLAKAFREIADKFPNTQAGYNAQMQWLAITDTTISAQTEKVNVPNKPFLSLVKFRNTKQLYYRIISLDMDQPFMQRTETYWQDIAKLPYLKQERVALPDPGDLREHSIELGIDGLPVGRYALLVGVTDQFTDETSPISVQYFHVSNISFVQKETDYYFLDRYTGKPLVSAEIRLVQHQFDYKNKSHSFKPVNSLKTDGNGYAKISVPAAFYGNYTMDIRHGADRLFTSEEDYNYNNQREKEKEFEVDGVLFTDRAIYRPGQPLYFKGILINKDSKGKRNSVIPGRKVTVNLNDPNGEKVTSIDLTSNAYGSIHGQFTIPDDRLTGDYDLEIDDITSLDFKVEEYKRPSFEVKFDTLKKAFRLKDEVLVSGSVAGLAGNMLNDARVKYRVVRETRMPWWWGWYRPSPRGSNAEITNGVVKSDANGKFDIKFDALPDLAVDKKSSPLFTYTVYADATDNSGETRSGSKSLTIGYQSMELRMSLPSTVIPNSLNALKLKVTNLEGQPLSATVQLSINKLQTPGRLLKERYWETPDLSLTDKASFVKQFPNEPYLNENNTREWKSTGIVASATQTVKDGDSIKFNALKPGWYRIRLDAKDSYGESVMAEQDIQISDTKNVLNNEPAYVLNQTPQQLAEPGFEVEMGYGSFADSITWLRTISDGNGEGNTKLLNSGSGIQQLRIKATENDRGGIAVNHVFVKHNRVHQVQQIVNVPWSNKDLQVSTMTYRDKLLPGSKETWKVKISGLKTDQLAAELLTSMYDASLDQFVQHNWNWPSLFRQVQQVNWYGDWNFKAAIPELRSNYQKFQGKPIAPVIYDEWVWAQQRYGGRRVHYELSANQVALDSAPVEGRLGAAPATALRYEVPKVVKDEELKEGDLNEVVIAKSLPSGDPIQTRKVFTETAFFLPKLTTDKDGNIEFSFTMPESLTKWKWMSFAHTKDLATGMMIKEIVTQKELMIQPNMPRFLREGDKIILSARVSNLSDKAVTGEAVLQLIDPETNAPIDGLFKNSFPTQYFNAESKQTTAVQFEVEVPNQFTKPLQYRIIAKAGNNSDGEENILPVLSNRMMVTESLPLQMLGDGQQVFTLEKLLNNKSNTLTNHLITVEYSTNPAWYAVLALPYLMEYPYECSEQTFSRYYANTIAANVANSSPAIKTMFEKWKTEDSSALISNLMKNQQLKQLMLEQTPWVFEAKSESQQRRNIALLFDLHRLASEGKKNLRKLADMQNADGSFPWFKGGPANRYITQHIILGVGRLSKVEGGSWKVEDEMDEIVGKALPYLDDELGEDYNNLIKYKADLTKQQLSYTQVQYLYMRSFFEDTIDTKNKKAFDYYMTQGKQYWLKMDRQSQAMIAIVLHRANHKATAQAILKSLKENAIDNPTLGMYWKENTRGYFWYQAPVETQSLLIEAFDEVGTDQLAVEKMKLWLLNQKRVQDWETTKATADAIYALVRKGNNWLKANPSVEITLGNMPIRFQDEVAGVGYSSAVIDGAKVKNEMGKVTVNMSGTGGKGLSWGAVHWQYFEDMDKITSANTSLSLSKQFFIERNGKSGPVLEELKEGNTLRVGDKLKVRIVLTTDRDMEFMHLKDMRASGTEPVNVLSGYRWQGGLGYYEATKDASTDFFFDLLPKGTWVFEYPLFVTHAGQFTAGIGTIQSMYAPEFNAHSQGRKIGAGPRE